MFRTKSSRSQIIILKAAIKEVIIDPTSSEQLDIALGHQNVVNFSVDSYFVVDNLELIFEP